MIIDAIIKQRDEHNMRKWEILRNLHYTVQIAENLVPHFDEWRVRDVGNEFQWFEERWPRRRRYLGDADQRRIDAMLEAGGRLVLEARGYIKTRDILESREIELQDEASGARVGRAGPR